MSDFHRNSPTCKFCLLQIYLSMFLSSYCECILFPCLELTDVYAPAAAGLGSPVCIILLFSKRIKLAVFYIFLAVNKSHCAEPKENNLIY